MIVLDIESSGTDPYKNSILSLGALDFDNPQNQFYGECRVWDGAHINDDSLRVNGFTKNEATDSSKKTETELVQEFIAWAKNVRDSTFVGQNPSFDKNFIEAACHRSHTDFPFAHRTLDTHTMGYLHMVKRGVVPPFDAKKHHSSLDLDLLLQYVGVPAEPEPHNALTGAQCHAEVVSRLLYDRPLLPEFASYPIAWLIRAV